MSHFSTIQSKLSHKPHLEKALTTLFGEVVQNNIPLTDYYGNIHDTPTEIVIRGNAVGLQSDIGFHRTENQTYSAIVDHYDVEHSAEFPFHTVQQFLEKVQLLHDKSFVYEQYPPAEWDIIETPTSVGGIQLQLTKKAVIL